ncbi:hypothetical protein [Mycolicibacterium sp.]|uniref:hypothetical protein n=1 Tax=Mycolicibacterium sp. TaxID=2320850 RepID=UPI0009F8FDDD|nr:hypothetical protein [Mycobacterium sp. DSM 3803]
MRYGTKVDRIRVVDDEHVEIDAAGLAVTARRAVVAAGTWSSQLLAGLITLPPLRITEEHPAHFALLAGDDGSSWPSFNHFAEPSGFEWLGPIYGLVSPAEGLKVGWHGAGPVVTRIPAPHPGIACDGHASGVRARMDARGRCGSLRADQLHLHLARKRGLVLDTAGPLVIAAGFAGHGFKFAPRARRARGAARDRRDRTRTAVSTHPSERQLSR